MTMWEEGVEMVVERGLQRLPVICFAAVKKKRCCPAN